MTAFEGVCWFALATGIGFVALGKWYLDKATSVMDSAIETYREAIIEKRDANRLLQEAIDALPMKSEEPK